MSLSQQDLFVSLLLPSPSYFIEVGIGNGQGEPCHGNTMWLEETGWKGMGFEIDSTYCAQARVFRPNTIIIEGDCLRMNWQQIFDMFQVPKLVDYLSVDVDGASLPALHRFFQTDRDFSILHIEHDLYSAGGPQRKAALMDYMQDKKYRLVVDDVSLSFAPQNYLESWWINSESEFLIPEIHNMFWSKVNPNKVIFDLCKIKKWD